MALREERLLKTRRKWLWLVGAVLLLALAGWLTSGGDPIQERPPPKVTLPRHMERSDWQRLEKRQQPLPVQAPQAPPPTGRAAVRDPLLRAMPSKVERAAVVVEANAIRNSDLGNLLVDCAFAGDDSKGLDQLRDAGFDPLQDLDRVGVSDGVVMLTGNFGKLDFDKLGVTAERKSWGDQGQLLEPQRADGGTALTVGLWGNQMMLMGESEDEVKAALDRVENRGTDTAAPVLSESQSYGEIYGVLMAQALADTVEADNPQLSDAMRGAASQVELHVDATHDVGLVADFGGGDGEKTQDLRKVMGTALSLAKLQAKSKGQDDAAQVLESARVGAAGKDGKGFRLEAGLPYEMVKRELQKCVERKRERRAQRAAAAAARANSPEPEPPPATDAPAPAPSP